MGSFETFAISALRFGPKKRGRAPLMSANKFYPRKEERELQELTQKEFERAWRAALAVAMQGMLDTLEQMNGMASDLPDEFKQAIGTTGEKIVNNAQQNLAKFSEMTIGTPYYPPTLETSIKTDWEATFQQLCISAETDAKAKIARLVSEGKAQGKNKYEVEELVEGQLPAETKHRAELISRTETAKLNNAATMATYESAGIEYYVWVASIDDRTRAKHAAMNGKICKVGEPDTWYEENPDDPLHPIRHDRGEDMYHGDPGTDFQCRCTSIPWDPRIDGKYEIKEAPEPEEPEPSKLEVAKQEAETAKAEKETAKAEAKAAKKAAKQSEEKAIQMELNFETAKQESEAAKAAAEAAKKTAAEAAELAKCTHVGADPTATAAKYGYQETIAAEKAIGEKIAKWGKLPLDEQKAKYLYEIKWVEDHKKYPTWELAKAAYQTEYDKAKDSLDWQEFNAKLDDAKKYTITSKSKILKNFIDEAEKAKTGGNLHDFKCMVAAAEFKMNSLKQQAAKKAAKAAAPKPAPSPAPKKTQAPAQGAPTQTNLTVKKIANEEIYFDPDGNLAKELPEMEKRYAMQYLMDVTGAKKAEAAKYWEAVNGFSCGWDYEIRQVQCGNEKTLKSRHGHTIEEIKEHARNLEKYLDKAPKWTGGDTYRGMSVNVKTLAGFKTKMRAGRKIDMRGAASWSTSRGVAEGFANSNYDPSDTSQEVIFIKKGSQKTGTSIRNISVYSHEHEILCSKDARYKITGYRKKGSYHIFEVDEE